MQKTLPENVLKFINRYFNLNINGKKIITPYFINIEGKGNTPVYEGKGTPEEIEAELQKMVSNKELSEFDIAELMRSKGLGLDCSGFVYHTYNSWFREKGKDIKDYLPKVSILNPRKYFSRRLNPQNSVSADEFTSEPISGRVSVKDVKPGDLIRTKSGKHVLFITAVEYNEQNLPIKIYFVHSTRWYKRNGMRTGEIYLNDDLNLNTARWEDNDPSEPVNHAREGWREGINTNGIFRPHFLQQLDS